MKKTTAPEKAKFELQDGLLLLGVVSLIAGIAAWSRPAAAVIFGLLCFGAVYLIETSKRNKDQKESVR